MKWVSEIREGSSDGAEAGGQGTQPWTQKKWLDSHNGLLMGGRKE